MHISLESDKKMKILILIAEINVEFTKDLSSYIREVLCCEEYKLFYEDALDKFVGEFDVCIIDRTNLENYALRSNIARNMILYFKKHFIHFSDIRRLLDLKSHYLRNEDYISAKDINQLIGLMNIYEKKVSMDALPTNIQIESTSYCNAECIMCRHFYTKNQDASHLSVSVLEKIESALESAFVVAINGYGEPFLSNSLQEQMEIYKKYKCQVSTNTNMSVANDKAFEWIKSNEPELRDKIQKAESK